MEKALVDLAVLAIQALIRELPGAVDGIRALVNKDNPTEADFEAAKQQIRDDTYGKLVTNSQIGAS